MDEKSDCWYGSCKVGGISEGKHASRPHWLHAGTVKIPECMANRSSDRRPSKYWQQHQLAARHANTNDVSGCLRVEFHTGSGSQLTGWTDYQN